MTAGPLDGIVVIDLTRVLAGPFCTLLLQDLGARVIKVELPERGDEARGFGPFLHGVSGYFASVNRGKESIALDLKAEPDRAVLERLIARGDVLVENFRPGVMERLGFGREVLHAINPRLIHAAVSGFGQTGPYARRAAYDLVVQAMGGLMSLTGRPGGEATRIGTSIGDLTAGLFTALGVAAALRHRERSGEATGIDIGMLDCQAALLENAIVRHTATGEVPRAVGTRHPSIAPFASFRTADGELVLAAANDRLFARLCEALGAPALALDPRFRSNALRVDHVDELAAALEERLRGRETAHWLRVLEAAGVPCGPINDIAQLVADPHIAARNMIVTVEDEDAGTLRLAGNPIKMSRFPDPDRRGPVPRLDGHRAKILEELNIAS